MNRALKLILLAASLLAGVAQAQTSKPTVAELRQKTFEEVWQSVNDRYFDPSFGGVDWNAVKAKYEPKIQEAKTDAEFHGLLNQMLGELKRSHFAVIPQSVYLAEEHVGKGGGDAEAGMTVQLVEGKPTVVRVEPGYPAVRAGIKPGFIVTRVGKTDLSAMWKSLLARKERLTRSKFLLTEIAASLLTGKQGQVVKIGYLDGRNRARVASVKLKASKGARIKMGELPALYGFVEAKDLPHGIGYVRFNIFLMPLLDQIQAAIESFRGMKGIIIDLRGNPGGLGAMAVPIARNFTSKQFVLGTMKMRTGEIVMTVKAADDPIRCPVAVLTDEGTGSTSEVFIGGMQESRHAFSVGSTTAGAVLPSTFTILPDGSRLQAAFADFKTPKGVLLEGRGVFPDTPVTITRQALLAGRDPVLDKAVAVLIQKAKGKK